MDIAIVGIGCRLPGSAETPEQFWDLLCGGVDAITEVPPDRFDLNEVFDPDPAAPGKIYTRWGGFVEGVARFDADFFGIAPREAKRMDPQHRLLLEVVWEALEDGGQIPAELAGTNTGVFIGIGTHDYGDLQMGPGQRERLDAHVNIGNALSAAPNRLSYQFDLRGPSMAIETACSSSLTAVHLACRSLETEESTLAIAGGVNLVLAPDLTIGFCKATMMSPDGRCRAFDARANGYVRGEGAGVVILKPLDEARSDGDLIYAVVRGTAVNEDGRTAGISLPNPEAHEALLREALRHAGAAPSAVQYFEAHGTGTGVGDPAEANAIGRVFGAGRPPGEELLVGSVKTNIGHLETASGVAGVIKAALMLRHKQVPPSLHFHEPNPAIPFDELRLRVPTALEPWPPSDGAAMAGVNSFGFGGANAHVILEEAPPPPPHRDEATAHPHVLLLSARTEGALREAAARHRAALRRGGLRLHDVCYTAAVRRSHHEHRLAAVGGDADDLAGQLDAFLDGAASPTVTTGRCHKDRVPRLAFVFAGMGPQWCGMGRQLLSALPVFREELEAFDRELTPLSGWSVLEELEAGEAESRIAEARVAQVVNCAVQVALARLWRSLGVLPDAVVGHSAGELAAAHVAGALSLPDTVRAAFHRGRLLHRATGTGTMLAAGITAEEAARLADASAGRVSLAAVNSRTSVTLSGDAAALEAIAGSLERDERFCRLLPVEVPYHGPQMDAVRAELLDALGDLDPAPAGIPLVSEVTGTWAGDERFDGDYWWRNVRQPVRFGPAVETLIADGFDLFVEISPHPVLASYVAECLAEHGTAGTVLPTLRRDDGEPGTVLCSLAALHVRGRPVDWPALYPDGACVPLPPYPWQRERHWFDPVDPTTTRVGVDSGHPLLGRRLPTAHPSWEADLDDPRSDYLDTHRVEDTAVFPGAAYVDMALAAACRIHGETPVVLHDVELHQLLFLGRPRDLRLQLLHNPRDGTVEILSAPRDEPDAWTLHAAATVRPLADRASTGQLDLAAVRKRCPDAVPVTDYYRTYAEYGFRYGPPFRGLEQSWSGDGEALARIAFPDDVDLPVAAHSVHPALLDAGFQLLVAAAWGTAPAGGRATGPLFPVSFRRIVWHRNPGERLWGHAQVRQARGRIEGDVTLLTEDGQVAVSCEGLRFTVLDEAQSPPRVAGDECLYELGWEPDPRADRARRSAPLRRAHEVARALERADGPEQQPGTVDYHEKVAPTLNRVAVGFTAIAFGALGLDVRENGPATADEVAERLGVVPAHRRLFATLLRLRESAATRDGAAAATHPDPAALHRELDTLIARLPAFSAEAELVRLGGDRLAEVLRGDVDAREILLSDHGLDVVTRLYHGSPPSRAYHALVGDAVAAAIGSAEPDAPLRLLEVGAGTGAATAAVLADLPDAAEYVFTDISAAFLGTARDRFGGRAGVRFEVLDIEADPAAQGFAPHSFDVVVAANVLHTTADLRASLGHVARLLVPGGLLAALELAEPAPWYDLTFGLLDGWWRFRDHDVRRDTPLLDGDRWRDLLEACGFAEPAIPFAPEPGTPCLQTVLLAHAPSANESTPVPSATARRSDPARPARNWLLLADDGGVAAHLAAALRDGGDRCQLVTRDDLDPPHPDGSADVPPRDAAVRRLLTDLDAAGERCDGIVHLWSLDMPAADRLTATELLDAQRIGCGSVLSLAQALADVGGDPPPLWLVTAGSQAVDGHGASHVEQAPLWGLGRVLMNEQATTRCRLVDLGPAPAPEEIAALADEVRGQGDDEEVALRGRERHVRMLRRTGADARTEPTTTRPAAPDTDAFRLETDRTGTLDRLALREAPPVEPGPGQVAIRVRASSLNFRDVLKGLGMLPDAALGPDPEPRALGIECSGTVVACGEDVDGFGPGDEVVALAWAAHGSRVVADAHLTVPKPRTVTFVQAASLTAAFVTAEYALNHVARLVAGERVLIHSAAGAVGLAAVQICQRVGAEVFATAGTPEKRAHLAELGVEHVMDSRTLDFADEVRRRTGGDGVDVVLNSLGGEAMRVSLALLRSHGRFVELGKRDIYDDAQLGLLPFQRNLSYTAVDLIHFAADRPDQARQLLRETMRRVADGSFAPVPCTTFDLADAEQAFRFMAQARHIGKVVLTVDAPCYDVRPAGDRAVRADGTYLVTGGLGGFGLAVAAWLVEQGARSLVLMGRSGVPKDGDEALEALRSSPASVHVVRADVTDEEDLARVLDGIRRELAPLRGVIHAAMVLDDDDLLRLDEERFRAVLAPKIAGAWNLDRQTADDPLDFFVLFSSVASVLGHPMQGNYAAANAFLDSLASQRRMRGLPALTVGWGAVADVGYVARHPGIAQYLNRGGFKGFAPQEALGILGGLLPGDGAHVIAARIDWGKLVGVNPLVAGSRRFQPFVAAAAGGDDEPAGDEDAARIPSLRDLAPEERHHALERYLVDKVAQVLGGAAERVDPDRPLTEMGFDSLMAVELTTAIRADVKVRLPAVKVLQGGTCRGLAGALTAAMAGEGRDDGAGEAPLADPPTTPAPGDQTAAEPDAHPLSFEQRRLWYLQRLQPENPAYNIPSAVQLSGPLDVDALHRSLQAVVERHEVLRAAVHDVDGEPVQVFRPPTSVALPVTDLSDRPGPERAAELQGRMGVTTRRSFDLSTGPLVRAALYRLAPTEHVLLLVVHHIACDAWSVNWMAREMAALYESFSAGRAASLPPPGTRYVDYVRRERERLDGELVETQLAYWTDKLAGAPAALRLPGDRSGTRPQGPAREPAPTQTPDRGAHASFALPPELTAELDRLSRDEGVTLFMTLLAGFQTLLSRYAGEDDICVATPVATREPDAEAVVGCFMNTLVLRGDLSGDPSFRELLQRTRRVTIEAFEHRDVPFDRVVEAARPARAAAHGPLFEAMLVLHNARLPELRVAGLDLRPVEVESGTAVTDLALLLDTGPRLTGVLEYDPGRLDAGTAQRMLDHFRTLLAGAVSDPDRRLSELPLLSPAERHRLLVEWAEAKVDLGEPACLHELVAAQARTTPDAPAVTWGATTLAYAELDERANRLAHHLCRLGVGPEAVVGVCMERSPDTVVALLAVLKAGAAYLPLDPGHPAARLRFQLDDAGVAAVLTQQRLLDALPAQAAPLVPIDAAWEEIVREPAEPPERPVTAANLAYVIYTSGSTGQPNGVAVEHRAVCNHLRWRQRAIPLDATDAVLQRTPLTFDPSVWEVFGPLAAGARLVIPEPGADRDGAALLQLVADHGVTTLQAVPALLDALLEQPEVSACRSLRRVVCGGEPLSPALRERFLARLSAELHHVYGPTEATIETTHRPCREAAGSGVVPIGRPIANVAVHILDGHLQPVPVGVPGEICIAGAGLARGYRHRPELTRERFVPHPFSDEPGARLYRSGDVGRWRADGTIEFLGRADDQTKIRGFRVETGEVEAVVSQHPAVRDVAVVASEDAGADRRLVAFVVATGDSAISAELQRTAADRLPDPMIPAAFVVRDVLPRTANGKVDRVRLAREANGTATAPGRVGPRDAVEARLVDVWASLLPGRDVGVTDDFFDLGGHSLLAMRAVARINHELGADLAVSNLVQERTIERLASRLREQGRPRSPLVAIQSRGSDVPFIFVHPVSGTVVCYIELARALGDTRPVYAIESAGLHDGEAPLGRIEDMARSYVAALRDMQHDGPYLLGGWSMGGMVAFEMARQLEADGQHVALLAVMDAYPASLRADADRGGQAPLLRSFARELGFSEEALRTAAAEFWQLSADEQLPYLLEQARSLDLLPPDVDTAALRCQLRVFAANVRAVRAYVPRSYPGRVTLIEAGDADGDGDRAAAWERFAGGGMTRYRVSADHDTMLQPPHVHRVAEWLDASLRAVELVPS